MGGGKLKLTLKQKLFADEYIICGNATEAAIKAGYSEKYANANGYKLLGNVGIKKYIDERLSELEKKKIATQDEVLQYLSSVMRGEHTEETLISRGEGYQEITNISVSAKDRLKAASELLKRYSVVESKDVSTEDKLRSFMNALDGAVDGN